MSPRLREDVFTDHSSGGAVTSLRMKNVEESVDAMMDAQEDVDEMRAELKVKILEIRELEKEFRFQKQFLSAAQEHKYLMFET